MANFTPTKKQASDFNNGIKYVNKVDTPSADDFNNVIESQLYSQNFAESIADTPDTSEASQVGVPSVTLINNIKNGVAYKKFKFANMKGDPGGVAPVENSQSTSTVKVPSSKLLKESSFARVYRSLAEISGITTSSTIAQACEAMIDNSVLIASTSGYANLCPSDATDSHGLLEITRVNLNRVKLFWSYANESRQQVYVGIYRNSVGGFSGWKQVIDDSSVQTISAIKTYSVSPLVPTTPSGPSAAVAKSYVDSLLTVYDKVIRTQAEFNALIASPTWLGATSVALVGQFVYDEPDNSGIKIPNTVKQIHGFNSAKITVTNFKYDESTAKGGLWYDTAPTTQDYSIRDLEVSCTGASTGTYGYGFRNCNNLSNCTGTGTGATNGFGFRYCNNLSNCTGTGTGATNGFGFRYCNNLSNCTGTGTGTGTSGYGFRNCNNLSNCTGTGTGTQEGYGFFYINYAVNCKDGGSNTDMWGGDNYNIDIDTCRKTPEEANNTTLNA